jgi:hypothetical protein
MELSSSCWDGDSRSSCFSSWIYASLLELCSNSPEKSQKLAFNSILAQKIWNFATKPKGPIYIFPKILSLNATQASCVSRQPKITNSCVPRQYHMFHAMAHALCVSLSLTRGQFQVQIPQSPHLLAFRAMCGSHKLCFPKFLNCVPRHYPAWHAKVAEKNLFQILQFSCNKISFNTIFFFYFFFVNLIVNGPITQINILTTRPGRGWHKIRFCTRPKIIKFVWVWLMDLTKID